MSTNVPSAPPGGFPSDDELFGRYALPNSRFVTVDGVRLHCVDEGAGPPVLLLHGSFNSLRQWDPWAEALRSDHRVIRFDWPAFGLSSADPRALYDADRKVRLLEALCLSLATGPVALVATSSAGIPAAAFAAARPDLVSSLILNNVAAGPIEHDSAGWPEDLLLAIEADAAHEGWHSPDFWRAILRMHYAQPDRVDDEIVTRWTELNNRQHPQHLRPDEAAAEAEFQRAPHDLRRVTCRSLVLWSDQDREVPLEREGRAVLDLLCTTDKRLEVIPDCGHMIEERGEQAAALGRRFLTAS